MKKWTTTQGWNRSYIQERRLLRLIGTTFDSKVASFRRIGESDNLIILQIINKQKYTTFDI